MALNADLASTLAGLSKLLRHCQDDYWIISSAAVALHINEDIPTADVDLLVSIRDAETMMRQLGLENRANQQDPLFRSDILLRYDALVLPVEVMAGFAVNSSDEWEPIWPRTREKLAGSEDIFVPDRAELSAMLQLFGRPKDLARLALLIAS
jgi:hypothetical protein